MFLDAGQRYVVYVVLACRAANMGRNDSDAETFHEFVDAIKMACCIMEAGEPYETLLARVLHCFPVRCGRRACCGMVHCPHAPCATVSAERLRPASEGAAVEHHGGADKSAAVSIGRSGGRGEDGMSLFVDVSYHEGQIDWRRGYDAGVREAYIRFATGGK